MNPGWRSKDFYRILEIDEGADQNAVRSAYLRKVGELHPETNPGDDERFSRAAEAYSVLGDTARREEYDRMRAGDAAEPATSASPPAAPPSGPWRWMRENLFDGDWWGPIAGNAILTVAVTLIGLNLSRFITSYLFNPDRKWSAVTHNMKLLMVQAFPQDDMIRIWMSIGIFAVLLVWSLASWNLGGRIRLIDLALRIRLGGALAAGAAVMHHGAGARTFGVPVVLQIDSPGDWSGLRLWVFIAAAAAGALSHLFIGRARAIGGEAAERSVPVLSLPAFAMAAAAVFLWTARLPVPEGQFDEATAPIAATTARPWTILFAVTAAAYFLGLFVHRRYPGALRRLLIICWIASYPVIIMIIQRKPVLDWADMLGFGKTPFLASDLGTLLLFGILGGAAVWVIALPRNKWSVVAAAAAIGASIVAGTLITNNPPGWLEKISRGAQTYNTSVVLLAALLALALVAGTLLAGNRFKAVWVKWSMVSVAAAIGASIVIGALVIDNPPAWLNQFSLGARTYNTSVVLLAALLSLALVAGTLLVGDRFEAVRIIGSTLALMAVMAWFQPMPFRYRVLLTVFALVVLACATFGGTAEGRRKLTAVWFIAVALTVIAFRLGVVESALVYQSTTFLGGFNLTILLALAGIALSFPLGLILALGRASSLPIFRLISTGYIELVRSVPLITWLFFGATMLVAFLPREVRLDELVGVVGALALFNSAYLAENIRGGLQSINRGQYEAARAVGLSTVQSTSLIILPQAIRAVIPALVGQIIVSFKDTSLVAIIGLTDVLLIARSIIPQQSNPSFQGTIAQMMFFMALFYWVFTFSFSRMSLRVERNVGLGER